MAMTVVKRDKITDQYGHVTQAVENDLKAWLADAEAADWLDFVDVKKRYSDASEGAYGEVTFPMGDGSCNLVVKINYATGTIQIVSCC